jgi:hypothetical protein
LVSQVLLARLRLRRCVTKASPVRYTTTRVHVCVAPRCSVDASFLVVVAVGRIVVVGKERDLPYDRIKLSKAMTAKVDSILLRPESFYQERNIELLLGKEVSFCPIAVPSRASLDISKPQRHACA